MARKRYTAEQIIGLLREAEVRLGQGQATVIWLNFIRIERGLAEWKPDDKGVEVLRKIEMLNIGGFSGGLPA
jgi:hypothetical protein